MSEPHAGQDLSSLTTIWDQVRMAQRLDGGSEETVRQAQEALMERYSGSVYRYLLGALRNRDAADELFGEFCLRFVTGAFARADPEKGRFRDYVKTALYHLIVDHQNRQKKGPRQLLDEGSAADPADSDLRYDEKEFVESWRNDVLHRAWAALDVSSTAGGQWYYRVLRLKAENPDLSSLQIAERLSGELGRPLTEEWVRTTLKRARERFSLLILDDLARSLKNPTRETLEQELIDLGLHSYCKKFLEQWRPASAAGGR
jgi:RNA polymerase sigma-70 factor (ECF subfamily)